MTERDVSSDEKHAINLPIRFIKCQLNEDFIY